MVYNNSKWQNNPSHKKKIEHLIAKNLKIFVIKKKIKKISQFFFVDLSIQYRSKVRGCRSDLPIRAPTYRVTHESTISVQFLFAPMFTEKSYVCCTISARPPGDARAGIVQCHLRHVYGLRAFFRFFSNLFYFSRNKIVKAAEPVNPYENLTAASCLRPPHRGRTEKGIRKRGYGQDRAP